MKNLLCRVSEVLWSVAKPANLHNYVHSYMHNNLHECATDYHLSEWFDE
ncbi:hypothetical protein [Arsukibacterium sp.]